MVQGLQAQLRDDKRKERLVGDLQQLAEVPPVDVDNHDDEHDNYNSSDNHSDHNNDNENDIEDDKGNASAEEHRAKIKV